MATDRSRGGTFSPVKRKINDDYHPADDDYPMGGTVIPSAVTNNDEDSGVRFPVHAEKLAGCNLVVEKDGKTEIIEMSARAMEILREGNRDGGKMNYGEAIEIAKEEEKLVKTSGAKEDEPEPDETPALLQVPSKKQEVLKPVEPSPTVEAPESVPQPPQPSAAVTLVEDSPIIKAQRADTVKPVKKGRKKRGKTAEEASTAPAPPKIPVVFSSSLGQMSVMAEKVFVGGPKDICLVIIQYSPEGHFFIPPQVDEPVNVSFEGKVYKCLTGIYYQIPGTPVMHTVYFIAKE